MFIGMNTVAFPKTDWADRAPDLNDPAILWSIEGGRAIVESWEKRVDAARRDGLALDEVFMMPVNEYVSGLFYLARLWGLWSALLGSEGFKRWAGTASEAEHGALEVLHDGMRHLSEALRAEKAGQQAALPVLNRGGAAMLVYFGLTWSDKVKDLLETQMLAQLPDGTKH